MAAQAETKPKETQINERPQASRNARYRMWRDQTVMEWQAMQALLLKHIRGNMVEEVPERALAVFLDVPRSMDVQDMLTMMHDHVWLNVLEQRQQGLRFCKVSEVYVQTDLRRVTMLLGFKLVA